MSVIVIGNTDPLRLGLSDCVVFPDAVTTGFDSATETWTVTTGSGQVAGASLVIDARPSDDPVIARHGVPNYFRVPGPNVRRQSRYVARCLRLARRSGASRIEARGRIVLRRRPEPVVARFYLTGAQPDPDGLYDGPATVTVGGAELAGRVRLTGHLDPVDGRFHWQGTVFAALPEGVGGGAMTVNVDGREAQARLVERTPWGTHMISGVGDPPFVSV